MDQLRGWRHVCAVLAVACAPILADEPAPASSPLDRLRQRSASTRWQSAKKELQGVEKPADAPVAEPMPATTVPQPALIARPLPADAARQAVPFGNASPAPVLRPEAPQPPKTADQQPLSTASPIPAVPSSTAAASSQASSHSSSQNHLPPATAPQPILPPSVSAAVTPSERRLKPETAATEVPSPSLRPAPRLLSQPETGQSIIVPPVAFGSSSHEGTPVPVADSLTARPVITRLAQVPPSPPEPIQQVSGDKGRIFRPITDIVPSRSYLANPQAQMGENVVPLASIVPPATQPLPTHGSPERYFEGINYQWMATNLNHNPLYFEDFALERYGHTYPEYIQPFVSVTKMGIQFIGLPYQMALAHPCNEEYVLGYLHPGDCNPTLLYQPPLDLRAATIAGGAYTGLIFLFP